MVGWDHCSPGGDWCVFWVGYGVAPSGATGAGAVAPLMPTLKHSCDSAGKALGKV